MNYWRKMLGTTRGRPPRVSQVEVFWSFVGSFLGIAAIALLGQVFLDGTAYLMMLGSFGASAVLAYGAIRSPLAQPRNLVGGHVVSALVGVAAYQVFQGQPWLAQALAVSGAIALMHLTQTLHPPGGATALIAVIGGERVHELGFVYAVMPAGLGALVLLAVALLVNNIPSTRRYPEIWF
jgi:CBS-domain-containing membrane protein